MQEEGGKKGLNPALEKHWEKIVLGAVVLLAVIFIGSKFSGGGNTSAKSVDTAVAEFKRKIDAQNPKIDGPKPIPEPKVPVPATSNRAPEWAIGEPTKYSYDYEISREEKKTFKFPDVSVATPTPSPEGVTISWSVTKLEKEGSLKRGDPIPVMPPYFYVIERKEKGGDWVVIEKELRTEKDNFSPRFIDDTTKPKIEYEYRVTVGSRDGGVIKEIPKGLSSKASGSVSVTTPGIWRFEFNNFFASTDELQDNPPPATVFVKIIKYDQDAGEVEWQAIHQEGKPLGFDKSGTSVHATFSKKKNRQVAVDFNCGGKIEKIQVDKSVPYEYQVCNVKAGPMGPVCGGPEKVKDTYKVNEIIYTDEDGKKQTYHSDPIGRNADRLCPDHGGAPPPKELTAEERLAQRETEATRMLEEAETLWVSEKLADRKKAQDIYKKLIASFADTTAVKPRKTEITERANKKKLE